MKTALVYLTVSGMCLGLWIGLAGCGRDNGGTVETVKSAGVITGRAVKKAAVKTAEVTKDAAIEVKDRSVHAAKAIAGEDSEASSPPTAPAATQPGDPSK